MYWLMCLLGISALLPYNVMLTEAEYFTVRTHQEPTIELIADNFETILVNSYTIGCLPLSALPADHPSGDRCPFACTCDVCVVLSLLQEAVGYGFTCCTVHCFEAADFFLFLFCFFYFLTPSFFLFFLLFH